MGPQTPYLFLFPICRCVVVLKQLPVSKEVVERSLGEQPEDGHQRPQGWVEARQAASALHAVKRGRFATAKAAEYHLKNKAGYRKLSRHRRD